MKRILIIATGGTIASTADGRGLSPALTGRELAEQVPLIDGLCELDFVQPMNIDSTNMMPADWLEMARIIREGYASYDGSQQPMANPFTDAKLNLYQSLVYALDDASSDVSVVFGGKAICGTHAHKQRTMSANAFTSINFPDLAMLRGDRIIRGVGLPMARTSEPAFFDALDERVCVLKLTPGLSPAIFETLKPAYDAVILETFGIGGIPEREGASYEHAIFGWIDSGRTVVITTQVPEEGLDLGIYEVGRAYAEHPGILRGGDMTTEALVAKTMWALAQTRDPDELARLFMAPVNHDRTN